MKKKTENTNNLFDDEIEPKSNDIKKSKTNSPKKKRNKLTTKRFNKRLETRIKKPLPLGNSIKIKDLLPVYQKPTACTKIEGRIPEGYHAIIVGGQPLFFKDFKEEETLCKNKYIRSLKLIKGLLTKPLYVLKSTMKHVKDFLMDKFLPKWSKRTQKASHLPVLGAHLKNVTKIKKN